MPKLIKTNVNSLSQVMAKLGLNSQPFASAATLEPHYYQPLFFTAGAAVKPTPYSNSPKWRLWAEKMAFQGLPVAAMDKSSSNVVQFPRRKQGNAVPPTPADFMNSVMQQALEEYRKTEKAPELRLTPQPQLAHNHVNVPKMGKGRKKDEQPNYTPPFNPRPSM